MRINTYRLLRRYKKHQLIDLKLHKIVIPKKHVILGLFYVLNLSKNLHLLITMKATFTNIFEGQFGTKSTHPTILKSTVSFPGLARNTLQ
jgi:hypothetical protein